MKPINNCIGGTTLWNKAKPFLYRTQKKNLTSRQSQILRNMHQITKAREEAMESKWAGCPQIHNLENIYITKTSSQAW
jgi:hypothetical protein